jgi:tripartite-type tricarboxylate transporter receptor subunit TctC
MNKTTMATALTGLLAWSIAAAAQEWPTRPITLMVPFAAGGGIDTSARIQALHMGELLGQAIVVENVGAAAGTTGSLRVAKSPPDGYTFLIGNSGTHAYSQAMSRKPIYDAVAEFQPVGLMTESPRILVARKDLPANNLQELIKYLKDNEGKTQFASAGVGSGTHLPCVLFTSAIKSNVTHVPYRGEGPAMQDVIAGRADFMCATIQSGAAQARQGTVKGIAIMADKRSSIAPDLPTTGEQGLPGVESSVWNAFFVPKGTPDAIVRKLNKAMSDTVDNPAIHKRLVELGLEIVPPERRSPEFLAKYLPEEIARWKKVVDDAGITPN